MKTEERLALIKRNTEEVLTEKDLQDLLKKKKSPSAYIGIAVTGPIHMGYLIPLGKMLDFDRAGIKNTILIADVHGALDDLKSDWDALELKAKYYKTCFELAFPWKTKPKFVKGSDFQLTKPYVFDALKLSTMSTVKRATRAASEVTRMKNPKVSELIYPLFQSLDEEYLKADIQLGGTDQRHILAFAREYLPKIGYKPRVEIMTPLVASLKGPGTKMSASIPESSIKVYDSEKAIAKKIEGAYCPVGDVSDNPILQLYQYIAFPFHGKVTVARDKKYGGDVTFKEYADLQKAFVQKELHPVDLKKTLTEILVKSFSKVRKHFEKHQDVLKQLGLHYL